MRYCVHTADATQLDSCVASAVCIGLNVHIEALAWEGKTLRQLYFDVINRAWNLHMFRTRIIIPSSVMNKDYSNNLSVRIKELQSNPIQYSFNIKLTERNLTIIIEEALVGRNLRQSDRSPVVRRAGSRATWRHRSRDHSIRHIPLLLVVHWNEPLFLTVFEIIKSLQNVNERTRQPTNQNTADRNTSWRS